VAASVTAIVPKGSDVLERVGACQVYSGENLYDYIDGGAPQYLEYGFREAASQELRYHGRTYILDIYAMDDALAAFGIFSTRRPDLPTTLPGYPRSCFAGYQGMVAQGPYYLEIQSDQNTGSTAVEMGALADLVFGQTKFDPGRDQTVIDSVLASLPAGERVVGSERIARGPVSLGATLGLSAGGTFLRLVEAIEKAMGAAGQKPALWLVAGYHRGASSSAPRSTLAQLVFPGEAKRLLVAIREAGYVTDDAESIEGGAGWIVPEPNGRHWAAAVDDHRLRLVTSHLPADSLRVWIERWRH
jgi:hypothetical protein